MTFDRGFSVPQTSLTLCYSLQAGFAPASFGPPGTASAGGLCLVHMVERERFESCA